MEDIVVGIVFVVFVLALSGVIILRPLSKRLADLLEMRHRERADQRLEERVHRELRELNESLARRMDLLEQRLDFTESLVQTRDSERAIAPGESARER